MGYLKVIEMTKTRYLIRDIKAMGIWLSSESGSETDFLQVLKFELEDGSFLIPPKNSKLYLEVEE